MTPARRDHPESAAARRTASARAPSARGLQLVGLAAVLAAGLHTGPVRATETTKSSTPAASSPAEPVQAAASLPAAAPDSDAQADLARVGALPPSLEPFLAPGVQDGAFAYLLGLLDRGIYGAATVEHVREALAQSGRRSRIPIEFIREVRRAPGPGAGGWTAASFTQPLRVPVPYSILGYHPGALVSSQEAIFAEQSIARYQIPRPNAMPGGPIELTELTLFSLVAGEILIDIDGWVDRILGGSLDDTFVVGLAVFRYAGKRYAMAMGFNAEGEGRSGALDLETDKIRFPAPDEFKLIGRTLRSRALQRRSDLGIPPWAPPK